MKHNQLSILKLFPLTKTTNMVEQRSKILEPEIDKVEQEISWGEPYTLRIGN